MLKTLILPPVSDQILALELGGQYYALVNPYTGGNTAMVWQARRLSSVPVGKEVELLQPGAEAYQRLVLPTREDAAAYRDPEQGEWTALKIARSGHEGLLLKELQALPARREEPGHPPVFPHCWL